MEYRTKQRAVIDTVIKSFGDKHFTADDICYYLKSGDTPVGRTTVYRCLERLVSEGTLKRFRHDDGKSACYQFIGGEECSDHFHLRCSSCGRIIHLECDYLSELSDHLYEHHSFSCDCSKIVIYGLCGECGKKGQKK